MRSIFGVVLGAFILWLVYIVSPLGALLSLADSVRSREVAAVERRIDMRALRTSLARQVGAAYMRASGAQKDQSTTSQFGAAAAAAIVDPLLAPYLTSDALMQMMSTGRLPGGVVDGGGQARGMVEDLDVSRALTLANARDLFFASEWRGFRTFLIALPMGRPLPERFRLEMQLSGFTWTVTGLELPVAARDRIVQQIIARNS
ncbi:DUF2939 domain-containing protein [Salinarimonas soli]|uniref:DUF2939 domain-containing protein n=1 Tax=Salinarimonas soli TaxID=1638099 RepID=A0A5B2VDP8_9HYPH|nr:DUF2939 domain-containing protein [Salinarimonas soli]KAA2236905.1 DUF2939 domain-containing protein [Salinarimonas soli]